LGREGPRHNSRVKAPTETPLTVLAKTLIFTALVYIACDQLEQWLGYVGGFAAALIAAGTCSYLAARASWNAWAKREKDQG
jgi:hypothetical protein